MENAWNNIYAKTFPGSQSRIMYLLEQDGAKKMSELANALHITAGAVTTASNLLIENGYIKRIRNDNDRRVVHVDLTEKGRTTLQTLKSEGRFMMQKVFKELSDEDLKKMCGIFEQASLNVEELTRKGRE